MRKKRDREEGGEGSGRNIKAPDASLWLFPAFAGKQVIIVVLESLLCGQS